MVEYKQSLAIGGYPNQTVVILHDVKTFVVDIVGFIWQQAQGNQAIAHHLAQDTRIVVNPLATFIISKHTPIRHLPFLHQLLISYFCILQLRQDILHLFSREELHLEVSITIIYDESPILWSPHIEQSLFLQF